MFDIYMFYDENKQLYTNISLRKNKSDNLKLVTKKHIQTHWKPVNIGLFHTYKCIKN
jgi:hypothetical protein